MCVDIDFSQNSILVFSIFLLFFLHISATLNICDSMSYWMHVTNALLMILIGFKT